MKQRALAATAAVAAGSRQQAEGSSRHQQAAAAGNRKQQQKQNAAICSRQQQAAAGRLPGCLQGCKGVDSSSEPRYLSLGKISRYLSLSQRQVQPVFVRRGPSLHSRAGGGPNPPPTRDSGTAEIQNRVQATRRHPVFPVSPFRPSNLGKNNPS